MEKYLTIILLLGVLAGYGQQDGVGIGTSNVDASAILEVSATNKGVLLPRVNDVTSDIASPKDGLIAYDIRTQQLHIFAGSWTPLSPMPQGAIIMWTGITPPEGWALCDGRYYNPLDNTDAGTISSSRTVQTPDLRGRFIVGYDERVADYDTTGRTGGLEEVSLSINEMPAHSHNVSGTTSTAGSHTHTVNDPGHTHRIRGYKADGSDDKLKRGNSKNGADLESKSSTTGISIRSAGNHSHSFNVTSGSSGGGDAHENRPPYYTLAYIMKL
ncbi:tail fiber protein [Marinoscillum furvescens]|uniref:Microcystin-dependent protein n=1 Tax=Marinoscillum furvescens DSM 4134 TaxID=1122208 RepID=A0A3D9L4M7_MARFU|nr:tail fiber protein [Marinoscillum furvescens]REE00532.1 microcystin-dependent protein [Marinoscillum furvescens DSM 4134]